jgi:hypothetical protein
VRRRQFHSYSIAGYLKNIQANFVIIYKMHDHCILQYLREIFLHYCACLTSMWYLISELKIEARSMLEILDKLIWPLLIKKIKLRLSTFKKYILNEISIAADIIKNFRKQKNNMGKNNLQINSPALVGVVTHNDLLPGFLLLTFIHQI